MAASTVENAIVEDWAGSAALVAACPVASVFIGQVPLLDADDTDELTPPYVTVAERSVLSTQRTNETTRYVTSMVAIEAESEERQEARAIADAVEVRFNRRELTWSGGAVSDMRPMSRQERQGPDGNWIVTWLFRVLYTLTTS